MVGNPSSTRRRPGHGETFIRRRGGAEDNGWLQQTESQTPSRHTGPLAMSCWELRSKLQSAGLLSLATIGPDPVQTLTPILQLCMQVEFSQGSLRAAGQQGSGAAGRAASQGSEGRFNSVERNENLQPSQLLFGCQALLLILDHGCGIRVEANISSTWDGVFHDTWPCSDVSLQTPYLEGPH